LIILREELKKQVGEEDEEWKNLININHFKKSSVLKEKSLKILQLDSK